MSRLYVAKGGCVGLLPEEFRFRIQKRIKGTWVFFDDYIYDLDQALHLWRRIGVEGFRVVKISWADVAVAHSIIKVR
jgi:hypothetical protein